MFFLVCSVRSTKIRSLRPKQIVIYSLITISDVILLFPPLYVLERLLVNYFKLCYTQKSLVV